MFERNTKLRLVVVSDIHTTDGIRFIKSELDSIFTSDCKADAIINAGDLIYIAHNKFQSAEELLHQESLLATVLNTLESYAVPHFFVPGNHDMASCYENHTPSQLRSIEGSINMHNHVLMLAPHLWLVGLGGSCSVRYSDDRVRDAGYPSPDDIADDLHSLFSLIPKGDQAILLTHCPPSSIGSSFADVHKKDDVLVKYGSDALYTQLCDLLSDYDIFLFIHGHVHAEHGMNWLHRNKNNCCILNPGSVMGGRFARATIELINGKWRVTDTQFKMYYG